MRLPFVLPYLFGQEYEPTEVVKTVGMVVENINVLPAVMDLAKKYELEMPIVTTVNAIINHGVGLKNSVHELMGRDREKIFQNQFLT